MKLIHATDRKYLAGKTGIRSSGLRIKYAKNKRKAIWCVPVHQVDKAIRHCLHPDRKINLLDVVLCDVDVPDDWVRNHGSDGSFYVIKDIPPEMISFRAIYTGGI